MHGGAEPATKHDQLGIKNRNRGVNGDAHRRGPGGQHSSCRSIANRRPRKSISTDVCGIKSSISNMASKRGAGTRRLDAAMPATQA